MPNKKISKVREDMETVKVLRAAVTAAQGITEMPTFMLRVHDLPTINKAISKAVGKVITDAVSPAQLKTDVIAKLNGWLTAIEGDYNFTIDDD